MVQGICYYKKNIQRWQYDCKIFNYRQFKPFYIIQRAGKGKHTIGIRGQSHRPESKDKGEIPLIHQCANGVEKHPKAGRGSQGKKLAQPAVSCIDKPEHTQGIGNNQKEDN
jgi:hypothetical protein